MENCPSFRFHEQKGSGHPIYQKVPLGSEGRKIRLLQLSPGPHESPVSARLNIVSLDETPDFNVLSYAWDSQGDQASISIQGHEFLVSKHLYQCLVSLRLESEQLVIWIDAICINQSSVDEKNLQVPLMRDIYQSARQTYVWLGEPTPGLELALTSIRELLLRGPDFKLESPEQLMDGPNTSSPDTFVDGIAELLHLGWFRRTWIIQEVALPRSDPIFVCGSQRMQWTDLLRWKRITSDFNDNIIDHSQLANGHSAWRRLHAIIDFRPFGALMSMRDIVQNSKQAKDGMELSSLLFFSQEFLATDPRDKIYGVMGLANAVARTSVTIDYNKDVEDLFEEITRYLIFKEGKLDHIALPTRNLVSKQSHNGSGTAEYHDTAPSWIRDFTFKTSPKHSESPLIPDWSGRSRVYDTGLRIRTMAVGEEHSRELRIAGMKLDTVEECTTAWYQLPERIQIFKNWKGILPTYFRAARDDPSLSQQAEQAPRESGSQGHVSKGRQWDLKYSPRGRPLKTMKEAIWRTMVADKKLDGFTRPPDWYGSFLEGYIEAYISGQGTNINVEGAPTDMEASKAVEEFHQFQHRLGQMMGVRSAFRTRDGWIGLGPDSMREGDLIAVLSGGDAPFVLRKCQSHYHVIGNCYVEGVMYGEIVKESMEGTSVGGTPPSVPGELFILR